nr:hypothetical protein Iba_scaffold1050CG0010 [Ipomoea batatas]
MNRDGRMILIFKMSRERIPKRGWRVIKLNPMVCLVCTFQRSQRFCGHHWKILLIICLLLRDPFHLLQHPK